jgi:hypothetical protein
MAGPRRDRPARSRKTATSERLASTAGAGDRRPSSLAWLALALAALTLVTYAGVWSFEFVQFDDPQYVYENPNIAGGLTWRGIQWAFTTGYAMNWHPVTWLSHMLDIQLFGLQPGPAHVVNLLLHAANVLLLFWFLASATGAPFRSAAVAALFAVHPLHVESVAWVSERKDVLSTLFWMVTLLAYLRYVRRPDWRRYSMVVVAFAIGLLAKPMLVTLPFVLLLLDWWPLGRFAGSSGSSGSSGWWRLVREKLPLFALAAASSMATVIAQHMGGAVVRLEVISFGLRIETALVSYAAYILKMFWPTRLFMYYPYPASVPGWQVATSVLFLVAVTAIVMIARRRRAYPAVGWLWYLGTLVPVVGLVQVGRQAMADRYTYIPLIGLCIVIVWAAADVVARWPIRRWLAPALAALVLVPCVLTARTQVRHWQNDQALWTHALKTATGLDDRQAALAAGYLLAERNVVPMQTLLFAKAGGEVFPALARQYLGRLFARHDHLDDAVALFGEAIRLAPSIAELHFDLGGVYARQRNADAAADAYQAALRINPDLPQAHHELALVLAGQGKGEEAVSHFAETVRLRPDSADAHRNLAVALAKLGRVDDALKELREVLRIRPDDADVRRAIEDYSRKAGRGGKWPRG